MTGGLSEKMKEAAWSVLPVAGLVLALHFFLTPLPFWTLVTFLIATGLLIIGMGIFTLGIDIAILPIGEAVGAELTKSRRLSFILLAGFVIGVAVTIAEPDLQVLTKQVPAVPDPVMVAAVAVGVGVFLVVALLRIVYRVSLSLLFIGSYLAVFLVAAFAAPDFLAVGLDSGGVTTGPITVPFILALGIGISAVRGSKSAEEDSFGLCALCSIGPVIAVLLVGMFFDASASGYAFEVEILDFEGISDVFSSFAIGLIVFFREIIFVLLPIVVLFGVLQMARLKLSRMRLLRIAAGIVYTVAGLTVFLCGANIGFMPTGALIGNEIAASFHPGIVVLFGAIFGFFVVLAEPAVHVLNRQVEGITSGAISKKMMMAGLTLGVSVAAALSVVRVLTSISLWYFMLPAYGIALLLTFFTPKIFTAIAFDSGGVAAGTMTAAFLLPFAIGICGAVGGNIMADAFGMIAMVAVLPLITVQIVGILYRVKRNHNRKKEAKLAAEEAAEAEVLWPVFEGWYWQNPPDFAATEGEEEPKRAVAPPQPKAKDRKGKPGLGSEDIPPNQTEPGDGTAAAVGEYSDGETGKAADAPATDGEAKP